MGCRFIRCFDVGSGWLEFARPFPDLEIPVEYFVYCRNKPDVDGLRAEHLEAHLTVMDRYVSRMIARGPTLTEDRSSTTGSMHIVDLESAEEAQHFAHDEPYARAGVFADKPYMRDGLYTGFEILPWRFGGRH